MDGRGTGAEEILRRLNKSRSNLFELDGQEFSDRGDEPEGTVKTTGTSEALISMTEGDEKTETRDEDMRTDYQDAASLYKLVFGEAGLEILGQLEGIEPAYDPSETGELGYSATLAGLEEVGMVKVAETGTPGTPEFSITEYGEAVSSGWNGFREYLGSEERIDEIAKDRGVTAAVDFLNDAGLDTVLRNYLENKRGETLKFKNSHDRDGELYELAEVLQDPDELEALFDSAEGESDYTSSRGLRGVADNGVLTVDGEKLYRRARTDSIFGR